MKTLQTQYLTFWFNLNGLNAAHEEDVPEELVTAFYKASDAVGNTFSDLPSANVTEGQGVEEYTVPVYEMCEPSGDFRTNKGMLVWPLELHSTSVLPIEAVKEFWLHLKATFLAAPDARFTSVTLQSIDVTSKYEVTEKSEMPIDAVVA